MNLGNSIIISSTQNTNIFYTYKQQISPSCDCVMMAFLNRVIIPSVVALEISLRTENYESR